MSIEKSEDQIFVDEIIFSVRSKDLIKTKILLREAPNFQARSTKLFLFEISKSEDSFAIPVLVHILTYHHDLAAVIPGAIFRDKLVLCNQLQDIFHSLNDVHEKCFFIESLGERQDKDVVFFMTETMAKETDIRLISSLMKVMSEMKRSEFASCICDFLYSREKELVVQAIKTLGQCSTDLAIDALQNRIGADASLDKLIVNTISQIQADKAIRALMSFLLSGNAMLRNCARPALAHLQKKVVPFLAEALSSANKNNVILCLNVLGESGVVEAVKPVRNFLETMPEDANIRFAAYEALGFLPGKTGAYTLTQGLLDEDEGVRVAAARAINQQFDPLYERGVVNLFKSESNRELIVDALLTAEANKIVSSMVHLPEFNQSATKLLKRIQDKELIDFYLKLARNINLTCDISVKQKAVKSTTTNEVCVVDDSRLLLKIYKKILTELDVSFNLFEFPETALEFIEKNKPSLVLTDLNMPVMDGIEFTTRLRQFYPAESLPVVMVTTQDEESDKSAALNAGVQEYLHKPFDKEGINRLIEKYCR